MKLTDHNYCSVLSRLFRGKVCDQLTSQPGRRFAPGEFVYRMGDRASSVYFLRSGLVKSSVVSEGGKEFVLHLHKPGEIFGELCLCSGEQRQQTMAMEQSEVVQIRFEDLISHLQRNRQAMSDFLISVSQRLSDALMRIECNLNGLVDSPVVGWRILTLQVRDRPEIGSEIFSTTLPRPHRSEEE